MLPFNPIVPVEPSIVPEPTGAAAIVNVSVPRAILPDVRVNVPVTFVDVGDHVILFPLPAATTRLLILLEPNRVAGMVYEAALLSAKVPFDALMLPVPKGIFVNVSVSELKAIVPVRASLLKDCDVDKV